MEEKSVDSFNLPYYVPSPRELEVEILKEGSLKLNQLKVSRINLLNSTTTDDDQSQPAATANYKSIHDQGYDYAKCVQSVVQPLLIHHFREPTIVQELFCRYKKIVDHSSKDTTSAGFECIDLTLSISKVK